MKVVIEWKTEIFQDASGFVTGSFISATIRNIVIRDEASFAVDGKFNTDNVQCYCP